MRHTCDRCVACAASAWNSVWVQRSQVVESVFGFGRNIEVYGVGNEERLTGDHETCSYKEFRSGGADRGASIRIPIGVVNSGHGYIEDRRPASNADPYLVTAKLLATACGLWLPVHGASLVEN